MRLDKLIEAVLIAALVAFSASYAHAEEFFARLNGFEEIGAQNNETGAVLSNGSGTLRLSLDKHAGTATFTLTYSDVGTTPPKTGAVSQAHIHFGKRHVAGGVMVRSEEHTSELQSRQYLVCRLLLEKKKKTTSQRRTIKTHNAITDET